jgi:hypothetical protein
MAFGICMKYLNKDTYILKVRVFAALRNVLNKTLTVFLCLLFVRCRRLSLLKVLVKPVEKRPSGNVQIWSGRVHECLPWENMVRRRLQQINCRKHCAIESIFKTVNFKAEKVNRETTCLYVIRYCNRQQLIFISRSKNSLIIIIIIMFTTLNKAGNVCNK